MKARKQQGDPRVAVAYLRVSTEEQNNGPEAQRSAIRTWAAAQGVSVVAWHEERISGGAPLEERVSLIDAIHALAPSGAGLLVAAKRDRIARDAVLAVSIERMVEGEGARLVTADGVTADDTPEGRLVRGILDLFAEYERALIRARTRAALRVLRARGQRVSRFAPAGTRHEGGRVVADAAATAQINWAMALRSCGMSWGEIARTMDTSVGSARRLVDAGRALELVPCDSQIEVGSM